MKKTENIVIPEKLSIPLRETDNNLYLQIKEILNTARKKAYSAVNFAMVEAYWLVGKQIVETQAGNERAEYGASLLKFLSNELTRDFGKGFDESNLRLIRQFYLAFPICDAQRHELSWTHYRKITSRFSLQNINKLYLPTEEELCKELENEKNLLMQESRHKELEDGGNE
ncbi:MAG: DUF1016 N-terminal domain-containing protein [Lentimicrobiaceae bacterium]|nr:DUF1016 N-terminal domain-containing protein [Lentimicrobiaceae bacterium]